MLNLPAQHRMRGASRLRDGIHFFRAVAKEVRVGRRTVHGSLATACHDVGRYIGRPIGDVQSDATDGRFGGESLDRAYSALT